MRRALVALVALAVACGGAAADLPAHGEALFVVDTDLPVSLAGRLRVDVYSEEGAWLDARDIGRSDPRDWPASFSVFSDDDTRPRRALVRLRAYPEGAVRPYAGEIPPATTPYTPPHVATSIDDLCANAPILPIGARVTLRQGTDPVTQHLPKGACAEPALAGAVAARVEIATAGAYRFSVADSDPYANITALSLRASCKDPQTQTACHRVVAPNGVQSPGHFARFDAKLEAGTYWLLSTGVLPGWSADTTLEVMPLDAPLPPVAPEPPARPATPRLVDHGVDRTPRTEPAPEAAVERLVLVELAPGVRGTVRVTLRGACAGTQAVLGPAGVVDPKSGATCVDTERVRVPLSPVPLDPEISRAAPSAQGTFTREEPCAPDASTGARVCIPGGVFLFGSAELSIVLPSSPQRIAVMPRFWIDRHEYTVARLRSALARGLQLRERELWSRDAPMPTKIDPASSRFDDFCTWSRTPMGREDYPLSCITWRFAREACRFDGGDLPTEAEWEYTAIAAGRRFKSTFPWGEGDDACRWGVFGRFPIEYGGGVSCPGTTLGPAPVAASDTTNDLTPQGVAGLGGSVAEWTLDAAGALDGPCWRDAGLVSPRCDEPHAPQRTARGSSWSSGPSAAVLRTRVPAAIPGMDAGFNPADPSIGFRCVYKEGER